MTGSAIIRDFRKCSRIPSVSVSHVGFPACPYLVKRRRSAVCLQNVEEIGRMAGKTDIYRQCSCPTCSNGVAPRFRAHGGVIEAVICRPIRRRQSPQYSNTGLCLLPFMSTASPGCRNSTIADSAYSRCPVFLRKCGPGLCPGGTPGTANSQAGT